MNSCFFVYVTMLYHLHVTSITKWQRYERFGKDLVLAYYSLLPENLSWDTEENRKNLSEFSLFCGIDYDRGSSE
jgi:hypothetical protein